jgi:hypothetical protein
MDATVLERFERYHLLRCAWAGREPPNEQGEAYSAWVRHFFWAVEAGILSDYPA